MNVIALPRGGGKTTWALRESSRTGYTLVVLAYSTKRLHMEQAIDMGLIIPEPITFDDFIKGRGSEGRKVNGYIIDNADLLLSSLAKDAPIKAVTISTNHTYEVGR